MLSSHGQWSYVSVVWLTSVFFTEPFARLWPCNSNGIFSCKLGDCSNNFTIASGKINWNAALREDIALVENGEDSSTISKGAAAAIGAGIGIPLLIALLVMLAMYIREHRKNRRLPHDAQSHPTSVQPSVSSRLAGTQTITPLDMARSPSLQPVQELDVTARHEAL